MRTSRARLRSQSGASSFARCSLVWSASWSEDVLEEWEMWVLGLADWMSSGEDEWCTSEADGGKRNWDTWPRALSALTVR